MIGGVVAPDAQDEDLHLTVRGVLERTGVGELVAVRELTGGALSRVVEADLGDGRVVVVKVYEPQWSWKQAKEVHVYGLISSHGADVPVPDVLAADGVDGPAGRACTVLTRLPGVPLSEVAAPVDAAARRVLYERLGGLMRELHRAVPMPAFGYVVEGVVEPCPDNATYVRRQLAAKVEAMRVADGRALLATRVADVGTVLDEVLRHAATPVLCHDDLHEGNVLVEPAPGGWRVTGVVDVENAVAADPLWDVAKTIAYAVRDDEVKRDGLLAGYLRPGEVLPDMEARLHLYRLYHLVELYVWFAGRGDVVLLADVRLQIEALLDR